MSFDRSGVSTTASMVFRMTLMVAGESKGCEMVAWEPSEASIDLVPEPSNDNRKDTNENRCVCRVRRGGEDDGRVEELRVFRFPAPARHHPWRCHNPRAAVVGQVLAPFLRRLTRFSSPLDSHCLPINCLD